MNPVQWLTVVFAVTLVILVILGIVEIGVLGEHLKKRSQAQETSATRARGRTD